MAENYHVHEVVYKKRKKHHWAKDGTLNNSLSLKDWCKAGKFAVNTNTLVSVTKI
jgi:hypothetical protein